MIRIGVCDDEKEFRDMTVSCIEEYMTAHTEEFEIVQFLEGEQVIEYNGEEIDLLFLDIEMGKVNGFDVLKNVLNADNIQNIVFVTSHDELMIEAFSVKTLGFVIKPVSVSNIGRYISTVLDEARKNCLLKFTDGSEVLYVKPREILYIEAKGNYSELHYADKSKIVDGKLKKCEEMLGDTSLIRVHKSYIVNLRYVKGLKSGNLTLENDEKIAVGRSFLETVKKQYFDYLKNEALKR